MIEFLNNINVGERLRMDNRILAEMIKVEKQSDFDFEVIEVRELNRLNESTCQEGRLITLERVNKDQEEESHNILILSDEGGTEVFYLKQPDFFMTNSIENLIEDEETSWMFNIGEDFNPETDEVDFVEEIEDEDGGFQYQKDPIPFYCESQDMFADINIYKNESSGEDDRVLAILSFQNEDVDYATFYEGEVIDVTVDVKNPAKEMII